MCVLPRSRPVRNTSTAFARVRASRVVHRGVKFSSRAEKWGNGGSMPPAASRGCACLFCSVCTRQTHGNEVRSKPGVTSPAARTLCVSRCSTVACVGHVLCRRKCPPCTAPPHEPPRVMAGAPWRCAGTRCTCRAQQSVATKCRYCRRFRTGIAEARYCAQEVYILWRPECHVRGGTAQTSLRWCVRHAV